MYLSSYIININIGNSNLLVNGINGHVDLISSYIAKLLQNKDFKKINRNILNRLINRHYIFNNIKEEEIIYKKTEKDVYYQLVNDKKRSIIINFSEACNLNCVYCTSKKRRKNKRMSIEHVDKIFEFIKKFYKRFRFNKNIILFGGEPLMEKNSSLFNYLLKKILNTKFKLFIISNGVSINKYIDVIKENKEKIARFQITLDGPPEIHDKKRYGLNYTKTFDLILNNIIELLKLKIPITLRSNMEDSSFYHLHKLVKILENKKIDRNKYLKPYLALIHTYHLKGTSNPITQPVKYIKKFRKQSEKHPELLIYKEKNLYQYPETFLMNVINKRRNIPRITPCNTAGAKVFVFASDNKIYACESSVDIKEFVLGEYFPRIKWDKNNVKKWKNRCSTKMRKCKRCPLVFICGGGCSLDAYEKNKSIMKPICDGGIENLKEFVKLNKDRILKLINK